MAKMVRRQCAFCPEDEECAIMYIAEEQNLAVHQDCLLLAVSYPALHPTQQEIVQRITVENLLCRGQKTDEWKVLCTWCNQQSSTANIPELYSSGFVESEEHNPENLDIRFDVTSVMSEIKRGKRLMCNFCRKKGATVGCEIKNCRRSYHYFCALCDDAAIETDEMQGIYRVFCPNHDPVKKASFYGEDNKREKPPVLMKSSSTRKKMSDDPVPEENLQVLRKKHDRHKVRTDFLRKCKQAGLLDEIFEEMLDTLHLAQEKLMDDNTSEAEASVLFCLPPEYEETVISLFDCGLFENILTSAHSGTEKKIQELLNTRKKLDTQIELLKDLKEVVLPTPEDTASASNSICE